MKTYFNSLTPERFDACMNPIKSKNGQSLCINIEIMLFKLKTVLLSKYFGYSIYRD